MSKEVEIQQELYIDLEEEQAWQWYQWHKQQEEKQKEDVDDGGTVIIIDMSDED